MEGATPLMHWFAHYCFVHVLSRVLSRIPCNMHHLHHLHFKKLKKNMHSHAYILHPGLGDRKSSKGATPLVFVVPERLLVVW